MSKETETMKHNAEVAQFRFALIAPVIQGLFPDDIVNIHYFPNLYITGASKLFKLKGSLFLT